MRSKQHLGAALFSILFTVDAFRPRYHGRSLAFEMVDSTIERGQGLLGSTASTGQIEIGIFQQALRESIAATEDPAQKQRWEKYLQESVQSTVDPLLNASVDVGFPLDRLSIGTGLIHQYEAYGDAALLPTIEALRESAQHQFSNANLGLWYYANPANLTYYHNLSYLDGMYSYPPFTLLSALDVPESTRDDGSAVSAILEQLTILQRICKRPSGLLVHGYDASKAHAWADPLTGASPEVWARSLAWYTLGILQSLEILSLATKAKSEYSGGLHKLFVEITEAQIEAAERSLQTTGLYGVWQVVDRPGEDGNFVEASASCMTAFWLLRGARSEIWASADLTRRARAMGMGIYDHVVRAFLIENQNGTLSLNGTSAVATLSVEDVDYEVSIYERPELGSN